MKRMLELIPIVLAVGCSEYTIPPQHISAPQVSIQRAEMMPVTNDMEAVNRLALAKRELAQAQSLQAAGQNRHADLMYLRADTDARLAMSTATERGITAEAQQVHERVRELRSASQQQ
jgi:hypothetical protein